MDVVKHLIFNHGMDINNTTNEKVIVTYVCMCLVFISDYMHVQESAIRTYIRMYTFINVHICLCLCYSLSQTSYIHDIIFHNF